MTQPKQGNCRTCHEAIYFVRTEAGKWMPYNLDGTSHFTTCPEADQWRGSSGAGDRVRRKAAKEARARRSRRERREGVQAPMELDQ